MRAVSKAVGQILRGKANVGRKTNAHLTSLKLNS